MRRWRLLRLLTGSVCADDARLTGDGSMRIGDRGRGDQLRMTAGRICGLNAHGWRKGKEWHRNVWRRHQLGTQAGVVDQRIALTAAPQRDFVCRLRGAAAGSQVVVVGRRGGRVEGGVQFGFACGQTGWYFGVADFL